MRVDDVSPTDDNTVLRLGRDYQSVSGKALCCAVSVGGTRAYLGGHSGVWRSDDGGATWWHPEWPLPPAGSTAVPGALLAANVYDLLIHPASPDILLAGTGRDARQPNQSGIYRSVDGARNWTRVHQFTRRVGPRTEVSEVVGCFASAPDDPNLIFAAGGFGVARSTDGGATWTNSFPGLTAGHHVSYVVAGHRTGNRRRVYAVGSRVWYSRDAGQSWLEDPQTISLGRPADGPGASSRSVAIRPADPRVVYILVDDGAALWRGRFPSSTSDAPGTWTQLATPPKNYAGTTASGGGFVVPHVTAGGRLYLFVSDRRTVHICEGEPRSISDWTRVEDEHCHLDPHGFAFTPDFHPQEAFGPLPSGFGRALLVNDGGANVSTDGTSTWLNGKDLSTLGVVNVAINPTRGRPPAICMGMGDNSGFSSADGGAHWETQDYLGGDNDACFADPLHPERLIVFSPRAGKGIFVYTGADGTAPDASFGTTDRLAVDAPPPLPLVDEDGDGRDDRRGDPHVRGHTIVSSFYNLGYRPLVLTVPGETPRADGDFVTIRFTDDEAILLRTTRIGSITSSDDWVTTATAEGPAVKVFRQGPPLPSRNICVVQASGGHASPTFIVGDTSTEAGIIGQMRLWKWTEGMADWRQLVPGPVVGQTPVPAIARRFFIDPYRPRLIYVLDRDHMRRSDDGGRTWAVDASLERALTDNGAFPFDIPFNYVHPGDALVRDMLFDPERPGCRFAIGPAGVFQTLDGSEWAHLVLSSALAARPNNAAYDPISCDRALYVATSNRGLLRLSQLSPDWTFAVGSLQTAEGMITLLRVNDVGTGYGPPWDRLDAEVIVLLDTQPEKAFGFRLRRGATERAARGMLALLRDAFNNGRRVCVEFVRTGCRTGRVARVIER